MIVHIGDRADRGGLRGQLQQRPPGRVHAARRARRRAFDGHTHHLPAPLASRVSRTRSRPAPSCGSTASAPTTRASPRSASPTGPPTRSGTPSMYTTPTRRRGPQPAGRAGRQLQHRDAAGDQPTAGDVAVDRRRGDRGGHRAGCLPGPSPPPHPAGVGAGARTPAGRPTGPALDRPRRASPRPCTPGSSRHEPAPIEPARGRRRARAGATWPAPRPSWWAWSWWRWSRCWPPARAPTTQVARVAGGGQGRPRGRRAPRSTAPHFDVDEHLGQWVVIDFFGSWCGPARPSSPSWSSSPTSTGRSRTWPWSGSCTRTRRPTPAASTSAPAPPGPSWTTTGRPPSASA